MTFLFNKKPLCFAINKNSLLDRLDPQFYCNDYFIFKSKSKFPLEKLCDISQPIKSGTTPKSRGSAYTNDGEGVPFLRATDLNDENIIDYEKTLYVKTEIHNNKLKNSKLLPNDILISIAGSIGKTFLFTDKKEANINQAIARVRLKDGYDPYFILHFLKSKFGQTQIHRLSRPVVQTNINLKEIGEILIPSPPPVIKNQLLKEIYLNVSKINKLKVKMDDLRNHMYDQFNDQILKEKN